MTAKTKTKKPTTQLDLPGVFDVPPANAVSPAPALRLVEWPQGPDRAPSLQHSIVTVSGYGMHHEIEARTTCEHDHPKPCPGCAFDAGPWEVDEASAIFDTDVFKETPE